jgi:hypothetical protein
MTNPFQMGPEGHPAMRMRVCSEVFRTYLTLKERLEEKGLASLHFATCVSLPSFQVRARSKQLRCACSFLGMLQTGRTHGKCEKTAPEKMTKKRPERFRKESG